MSCQSKRTNKSMTNKDFKYSILLIIDVILLLIAFASKNYMTFVVIMSILSISNFFSYKFIKE